MVVGFTLGGPPVYAPLFALAMLYKKFGRGYFPRGERLPIPDRSLLVHGHFSLD